MNIPEFLTNQSVVYQALFSSMFFATEMDHSNGYLGLGNAAVFPEVLIWAMGQRNPELIDQLQASGQIEELRELLSQYCSLRVVAEDMRSDSYYASCEAEQIYGDDFGYLTPDDFVDALSSGDWSCDDPNAESLIQRAAIALAEEYKCDKPEIKLKTNTQWLPSDAENHAAFELTATRISQLALLPTSALTHASRQLIQSDNVGYGSYWDKVYTSVICDWLEQDEPAIATEIVEKGLSSVYVAAVTDFRSIMTSVEDMWRDLSHQLRALLLQVKEEHEAQNLLRNFSENYAKSELEASTYATLLWEMVKRRNCAAQSFRVHTSNSTHTLIETVRSAPENYANCYLVDISSLPEDLRNLTDEHQALVVRLPESWLSQLDALQLYRLQAFFREDNSSGQLCSSLRISSAFCCDHESLWPLMFAWRRHVPVVYVLDEQCVFARHVFRHFVDLRHVSDTPARHWPTNDIIATRDTSNASAAYIAVDNGPRSNVPPAILANINDLRTARVTTTLKEAFLAAQSEFRSASQNSI